MKPFAKLILIIAALTYTLSASAQKINLRERNKPERDNSLIELSVEIVKRYGPGCYRNEFEPIITVEVYLDNDHRFTKYNGRK